MIRKCKLNKTANKKGNKVNCKIDNPVFKNENATENNINQKCCVCLNSFLDLNSLEKTCENGITLLEKLRVNVVQVDWQQNYFICDPCTNLLNIVNKFRETCLRSDFKRQELLRLNIGKLKCKEPLKTESDSSEDTDTVEDNIQAVNNENVDFSDNEKSDKTNAFSNNVGSDNNEDKQKTSKRKRKVQIFTCEVCSNVFLSSTTLIKHCVNEHGMVDKEVRPFACSRCRSRFANSSNLLQHIKYHDAVRCNICTFCGKGFITKTDLVIHEKQHLNKREYVCDICNKCYNTHKDLRSHKLVVHTAPESWKYFCEECKKYFPIKSNYDCHMRRHTGDKKFECHLCNKKFTDKCVLQRHMRTHTNVRDFKCSECYREYKDKRVMQIHMAKVHAIGVGDIKLPTKEKKHQCHICPKAYYAKNKLQRHIYTHTGEKPYYCELCDKKFNDKSYVKMHMKKTHNVDTTNDS